MKTLLALLTLVPLTLAAVAKTSSKSYTDTFDKRAVLVGADQGNVVDCTAGGALCYNAFVVSTTDPLVETAPSSPNVILTAALAGQDVEGQPSFYINNTVKCFTPTRICYAITVNSEQSAANVAQSGTIQFAGVEYGTGITVIQEGVYNPTVGQVPFKFACTNFAASFACLTRVDVELIQAEAGSSPLLSTVMFDNVSYTAYYSS